jgi:hypothetical protein
MSAHTPAPWVLDPPSSGHVIADDYHVIEAGIGFLPPDGNGCGFHMAAHMTPADARLIAAAPDLLHAARAAEAVLGRQKWIDSSTDPEAIALRMLRAAIALATGEAA